jgi:hypothetical protein
MHMIALLVHPEPVDEGQTPKTVPDFDGAGACWVDAEQVKVREGGLWTGVGLLYSLSFLFYCADIYARDHLLDQQLCLCFGLQAWS